MNYDNISRVCKILTMYLMYQSLVHGLDISVESKWHYHNHLHQYCFKNKFILVNVCPVKIISKSKIKIIIERIIISCVYTLKENWITFRHMIPNECKSVLITSVLFKYNEKNIPLLMQLFAIILYIFDILNVIKQLIFLHCIVQ